MSGCSTAGTGGQQESHFTMQLVGHGRQIKGCRSATAANDTYTGIKQGLNHLRHFARCCGVGCPIVDYLGRTSVGLNDYRRISGDFDHFTRQINIIIQAQAGSAVGTNNIGAGADRFGNRLVNGCAHHGAEYTLNRRIKGIGGDNRPVGDFFGGMDGQAHFNRVAHGLDNDGIGPATFEAGCLLAEQLGYFSLSSRSQRFDEIAERADVPQ